MISKLTVFDAADLQVINSTSLGYFIPIEHYHK